LWSGHAGESPTRACGHTSRLLVGQTPVGAPLSREATEALEFNLAHDGGGLVPVGRLNQARPIVYRASQAGRAARRRLSSKS